MRIPQTVKRLEKTQLTWKSAFYLGVLDGISDIEKMEKKSLMKFKNIIKKIFGKKYTGCRKKGRLNKPSWANTEVTRTLRGDADTLQAKYKALNLTIVIYDSNSNIEYISGPEVKVLDGTTHKFEITEEMMKEAVKNYEERNK